MRTAQCQCGQLKAEAEGEPTAVVVCSCIECQRRSGSAFGEGAYFARENVRIIGRSREYVRLGQSGKLFRQYFCETCGTSLWWFSDRDPERIGIAVGAFADPEFPRPARSVFDRTRHDWLEFPADIPGFVAGRDSERSR